MNNPRRHILALLRSQEPTKRTLGLQLEEKQAIDLSDFWQELNALSLDGALSKEALLDLRLADTWSFAGKKNIVYLPRAVRQMQRLKYIVINCGAEQIHFQIAPRHLSDLAAINFSRNQLSALPDVVWKLKKIWRIEAEHNALTHLPTEIAKLPYLTSLYLGGNQFAVLPTVLGNLPRLKVLSVWENRLKNLPDTLAALPVLDTITATDNQFSCFPTVITAIRSLEDLDLSGNQLSQVPETINNLEQIRHLRLGRNRFSLFPMPITTLKYLEQLSLWGNQLSQIPANIGGLQQLKELDLSFNPIAKLPPQIEELQQLQRLRLQYTRIPDPQKRQLEALLPNCKIEW